MPMGFVNAVICGMSCMETNENNNNVTMLKNVPGEHRLSQKKTEIGVAEEAAHASTT